MSSKDLEAWMKRTGNNEIDIAAALKIHPVTVTRYLRGDRMRRSTIAMFERLIAESTQPPLKAAAS